MTVVPLFCAKLIKGHQADDERANPRQDPAAWLGRALQCWFNRKFNGCSTLTKAR
jgi:hypothetical protein